VALASVASHSWEQPLVTLAASFRGHTAFAIGLVGIAVSGATLVWSGDLSDFGRRILVTVLAVSAACFGAALFARLFGGGGAVL
jgi:type IV secretion system protein TrbC